MVRFGLISANIIVVGAVIAFILKAPTLHQSLRADTLNSKSGAESITNPLDQLSSADIAVNVARITRLPEAQSVVNHADSVNAQLLTAQTEEQLVAKPIIASEPLPSKRDIKSYVVVPGDTVSSIANANGISSDSIRWSNGLNGDSVSVGSTLYLPPSGRNGIVYVVKTGDTAESLARRFSTSKELVIAFNDAEVNGLTVGERILIPNGIVVPIAATTRSFYSFYSGGGGSYAKGWCTDYASARGGAPGGWGNANTWAIYASRTPGWAVSTVPRVGSIAWTSAGYAGHVGIVDAISDDGSMIKYSDMNGVAGWGRVGYSDWVPTHSVYQKFIYRQ